MFFKFRYDLDTGIHHISQKKKNVFWNISYKSQLSNVINMFHLFTHLPMFFLFTESLTCQTTTRFTVNDRFRPWDLSETKRTEVARDGDLCISKDLSEARRRNLTFLRKQKSQVKRWLLGGIGEFCLWYFQVV